MGRMTDENWAKLEAAKKESKERAEKKAADLKKVNDIIEKAGLQYRYFRNNNPFKNRTNKNHEGVICFGYKILSDNDSGIKVSFSVAFCAPGDSFSRFEAKKILSERYVSGNSVTSHIDLADRKYIAEFIRLLWNGGKVPLERIGIKSMVEGKPVQLKRWMKYIR